MTDVAMLLTGFSGLIVAVGALGGLGRRAVSGGEARLRHRIHEPGPGRLGGVSRGGFPWRRSASSRQPRPDKRHHLPE